MFGDLLGTQGFDFSSTKKDSGPKTINAAIMRKEELAKDIDPDKMKVSVVCLILLIKFHLTTNNFKIKIKI